MRNEPGPPTPSRIRVAVLLRRRASRLDGGKRVGTENLLHVGGNGHPLVEEVAPRRCAFEAAPSRRQLVGHRIGLLGRLGLQVCTSSSVP